MELALLGDLVTAAEAERIGLVSRCAAAAAWEQQVTAVATQLAGVNPRAAELILTGLRHAPAMDLDATLEWEASAIPLALASPEARAAFSRTRG